MSIPSWGITVIGIVLAFGGFTGLGLVFRYTGVLSWLADRYGALTATNITKWVATGGLLAFVVGIEGRGIGSITLNALPAWQLLIYALMGYFAMIVGMGIVTLILRRAGLIEPRDDVIQASPRVFSSHDDGPIEIGDQSWSVLLATAVTAGATEEILTTGYPVVRIAEVTGVPALGIAVSAVVFGLLHRGYSWPYAIITMVPGLVFGAVFWLSGSLLTVIVMHTLWDVLAFGVRKFRGEQVRQTIRRVGPDVEG